MDIEVNKESFEYAKYLINDGRFVADKGDWTEVNPDTEAQDTYIHEAGMKGYAKWHLGIKQGGSYENKSTYSFPYGDFKVVHRAGLLAAEERAQQYEHLAVRDAARELLTLLDSKSSGQD